MKTIVFHSRYVTSEFEEGEGPGYLLDNDVHICAQRAYRQARRHLQTLERKGRAPPWKLIRCKVRKTLVRITRDYWRDFDYDDRITSAQVKDNVKKLVYPLSNAIAALESQSLHVRRAIEFQSEQSQLSSQSEFKDIYSKTLIANQTLLQACEVFVSREHSKLGGGAIRFKKACRELAALWSDIFSKRFSLNSKTAPATDDEADRGVKRAFTSPGPAFVYLTLHEIGNRWVTVSQVGDAVDAMKGGK